MAKIQAKQRMKNLLLFLPNLVALCWKLLTDSRVPKIEKALLGGAVIYAIVPLDFIPDFLPFIGQVDDTYLIALTLMRLLQSAPQEAVREHWRGGRAGFHCPRRAHDFAQARQPRVIITSGNDRPGRAISGKFTKTQEITQRNPCSCHNRRPVNRRVKSQKSEINAARFLMTFDFRLSDF